MFNGCGICTPRDSFARHSFVPSTLPWAAQARSSMREMAAASAPRVTALLVTQAFERAALGSAAHLSMRAVAGRMPRDSLARHSLGDSALL
jgi:hypothetical protein